MASALFDATEALGHGRVGLFLEGGYDLMALEGSVAAVVRAALGDRTELPTGRPKAVEREAIDRTIASLGGHLPAAPA